MRPRRSGQARRTRKKRPRSATRKSGCPHMTQASPRPGEAQAKNPKPNARFAMRTKRVLDLRGEPPISGTPTSRPRGGHPRAGRAGDRGSPQRPGGGKEKRKAHTKTRRNEEQQPPAQRVGGFGFPLRSFASFAPLRQSLWLLFVRFAFLRVLCAFASESLGSLRFFVSSW